MTIRECETASPRGGGQLPTGSTSFHLLDALREVRIVTSRTSGMDLGKLSM